jgi:hypothetical protein
MDPTALTSLVTALANWLYCRVDEEDLAVCAAIFTQLGDTLATLAVQKDYLEQRCLDSKK